MKNSLRYSKQLFFTGITCITGAVLIVMMVLNTSHATDTAGAENVIIDIKHGIQLPWGVPGFRITVSKWMPNVEFTIIAVAPDGKKRELVPMTRPLKADENGEMAIDVDYQRKGLSKGHWLIFIAGKPGVHTIEIDLPEVEPPTKERNTWRLIF